MIKTSKFENYLKREPLIGVNVVGKLKSNGLMRAVAKVIASSF